MADYQWNIHVRIHTNTPPDRRTKNRITYWNTIIDERERERGKERNTQNKQNLNGKG